MQRSAEAAAIANRTTAPVVLTDRGLGTVLILSYLLDGDARFQLGPNPPLQSARSADADVFIYWPRTGCEIASWTARMSSWTSLPPGRRGALAGEEADRRETVPSRPDQAVGAQKSIRAASYKSTRTIPYRSRCTV